MQHAEEGLAKPKSVKETLPEKTPSFGDREDCLKEGKLHEVAMRGLCWLRLDCAKVVWAEFDRKANTRPSLAPFQNNSVDIYFLVSSDRISHVQRFQCIASCFRACVALGLSDSAQMFGKGAGAYPICRTWAWVAGAMPAWGHIEWFLMFLRKPGRTAIMMVISLYCIYIYIWQFSKGRLSHAVQDSSLVQWICIYFQVHYNVCVWALFRVSPRPAFLAMMLCLLVSACQQLRLGPTWVEVVLAFHGHLSTGIDCNLQN